MGHTRRQEMAPPERLLAPGLRLDNAVSKLTWEMAAGGAGACFLTPDTCIML